MHLLGQIGYKKISNNYAQIVRLSEPKLHLHTICILSYDCEIDAWSLILVGLSCMHCLEIYTLFLQIACELCHAKRAFLNCCQLQAKGCAKSTG